LCEQRRRTRDVPEEGYYASVTSREWFLLPGRSSRFFQKYETTADNHSTR